MPITASKLRQDVYRILDQVLETGVSVEIVRRGKKILLAPVEMTSKIGHLKRRDYLRDVPESFVHIDWSSEWRP